MTETKPADAAVPTETGFFVNQGTLRGDFTTPDGARYDIAKLEPREVTDPRKGEVTTIWGGYATARDLSLAAKDAMLQSDFRKSGNRPAELFAPEARDIPLYITLRPRAGKGHTHIGSFWNSAGRHTVLARDLEGKGGLRFGGNVLSYKSPEALAAEKAAKANFAAPLPEPDAAAARDGAEKRGRKGKAPAADQG